jgi:hypothetical protein
VTEPKQEYQLAPIPQKAKLLKPKKEKPIAKNKLKVVLGQSKEKQPKKQMLGKKKVRSLLCLIIINPLCFS